MLKVYISEENSTNKNYAVGKSDLTDARKDDTKNLERINTTKCHVDKTIS